MRGEMTEESSFSELADYGSDADDGPAHAAGFSEWSSVPADSGGGAASNSADVAMAGGRDGAPVELPTTLQVGASAATQAAAMDVRGDAPPLAESGVEESAPSTYAPMPAVSTRAQAARDNERRAARERVTAVEEESDTVPPLACNPMAYALPDGALAPVAGQVDRNQEVIPEGLNRAYPAPREYDDIDPYVHEPTTSRTLGRSLV